MKLFCLIISLLILESCVKNNENSIEFKGLVIRGTTECSTSKGFPYIIVYTTTSNSTDSFITGSLPPAFNLPGTKILFKINNTIPLEEILTCNTNINPPVQKSIFDVKFQ
jgi:hypothetical protein